MTDAIPSDHPTVESARVECSQVGRTGRPQLLLPAAFSLEGNSIIRLVIDGRKTHARVVSTLDDERAVESAYANRRLAREETGTNILREFLDENGFGPGDTLVLDELAAGHAYGLRKPGERVVYEPIEPPNSSLADIARSLDE